MSPDSHSVTTSVTSTAPAPLAIVSSEIGVLPSGSTIASSSRATSGSTPTK
jgi:hypothetical protein